MADMLAQVGNRGVAGVELGGVCVEVSGSKGLCSVYGVTCGDGHI